MPNPGKILGHIWDKGEDTLIINQVPKHCEEAPLRKRTILMVGEQQLQNCACEDVCCSISLNALPFGGDSVMFGDDHGGDEESPAMENCLLSVMDSMDTQHPLPQDSNNDHLEDRQLIARARAVGMQYEFTQHGIVET